MAWTSDEEFAEAREIGKELHAKLRDEHGNPQIAAMVLVEALAHCIICGAKSADSIASMINAMPVILTERVRSAAEKMKAEMEAERNAKN